MLEKILSCYGIHGALIRPYGSGLINSTWVVQDSGEAYILQKINHQVFRTPEYIAQNIQTLSSYVQQYDPGYYFVSPVLSEKGDGMVRAEEGYFRLFPFVSNSKSFDVALTPGQAFEAARQFGLFTKTFSGLPAENLKITLPGFHNLTLRHAQFEEACRTGNPARIQQAGDLVHQLRIRLSLVDTYAKITTDPDFRLRTTHHDTKISNVLFSGEGKGICVIDLDTVMPGFFISDVGDMMRTYLSPVSEEEKDFSRICIREEYFEAILKGYLQEMAQELSPSEIRHFVYAGKFLIYMQALRFLTDHFNNDTYYGASYEGHNLVRAQNQFCLLQRLEEKEEGFTSMVMSVVQPAAEQRVLSS